MGDFYHYGNRKLQETFQTKPMADRLAETIIQPTISPEDKKFIEEQNMFFLATVDNDGNPNCSYKGGASGFVRVLDESTLAFPSYDGNSMFLSMGNILVTSSVGLLFVDFNRQTRLRVNGDAFIDLADTLLPEYHQADIIVRVKVRQVFPNCPRYVHKMLLAARKALLMAMEIFSGLNTTAEPLRRITCNVGNAVLDAVLDKSTGETAMSSMVMLP